MRTQLSVTGRSDLELSNKNCTFATAKESKIKATNNTSSNLKVNSKLIVNNIINNISSNMELIYSAVQTTLSSFDFAYCIIVNVLTYIIINIINSRNGNIDMSTWSKRGILLCCIAVISCFYYFTGSDLKLILNSAIISPVFWSWIIKPICKHFRLDYKQLNLFE